MIAGYLHPRYAESLIEFGTPHRLPGSGAWILKRQIPGFSGSDAMWCYPLFACQDWSQLYADLEGIENDLITLSAVTDPFGAYDMPYLQCCFKDVIVPFKEHFIIELGQPVYSLASSHHRRYARQALRSLQVKKCENPAQFLDTWMELYDILIERHRIKGIPAFSRSAFVSQLNLPGIVAFRAVYEGTTVGMLLWYVQNGIGYYHLGAFSLLGYELRASFALFWSAIEYFTATGLAWLNLGAGASLKSNGTDGLSRFKQGWSTGTRTAYFCGRIFNQTKYLAILQDKGISANSYFPAYREGEFR